MKKTFFAVTLFFILAGLASLAQADLNVFLNDLNHQAATDRYSYNTRLSNQFGIPLSRTESIVRSVDSPAHAFMLLQLGVMSGRPFDTIFNIYQRDRKKGWGAMAQQLGIKPGSPEFHALKRGDFVFSGKRGEKGYRHHDGRDSDRDKDRDRDNDMNSDMDLDTGKGKGKGKGKNK
jgi:hypothetical protein